MRGETGIARVNVHESVADVPFDVPPSRPSFDSSGAIAQGPVQYSVRSDRLICETLDYDILFRWFLDMNLEESTRDAGTFSKNRTGCSSTTWPRSISTQ